MNKLIINFSNGQVMPISWEQGTDREAVKADVARLLRFRLRIRERATKKSDALALRLFTIAFSIGGETFSVGIENVKYSPKKELLNDSLNELIDIAFDAMELKELQENVGAAKLEAAQVN